MMQEMVKRFTAAGGNLVDTARVTTSFFMSIPRIAHPYKNERQST